MVDNNGKMTFDIVTRRDDAHGSTAHCKEADILLDTDMAGRQDLQSC